MTELILTVPDSLATLPVAEYDHLLRAGLRAAVLGRVDQLAAEIAKIQAQLAIFEQRYQLSFAELEARIPDTVNAHEDYNDWFYWDQVLQEKQKLLDQLQQLN